MVIEYRELSWVLLGQLIIYLDWDRVWMVRMRDDKSNSDSDTIVVVIVVVWYTYMYGIKEGR